MAAMAGTMSISTARADDAQAKTLFKAMSDYLAAQQAISFDFDSTLEVVTDQEQKLGLASSGTLILNRPDKLHATPQRWICGCRDGLRRQDHDGAPQGCQPIR
jgi:hypothetical protein